MRHRTVARVLPAHALNMGAFAVHQPLPTQRVDQIDPFLLLHHFGPFPVEAGGRDPLDLGPHPHRGFEPVTFLYQGGMRHRDSRGNTGHLRAGDVQWMTAGMGIIHSERASREFMETGGTMEGIQLWVNLSPANKMVQPRYQDLKAASIPTVELPGGGVLRLVAGAYGGVAGAAQTHESVLAWQLELPAGVATDLAIPKTYNAAAYLLDGGVATQSGLPQDARTLLEFRHDGDTIHLENTGGEAARVLVLGGQPIGAPVVSHGPYVMNNQTEIMQAMRDYGMGKMGFYVEE
ncbi:pirin family protein [Lewinella sp. IMCC34183]|uniref:pirin family protein n=1 Tax=Lewinella sp. IMCC34183 TaxID=2248762 RepID=UPI000E251E3B|nr:pirin family protein [Lewinella sp. IMCC34183]